MKISIEGKGPVVVLSHALALDQGMWATLARALAQRYTVVRYDHRGHGGATQTVAPFSIEELADDVADLIRRMTTDPVVFVGLSLGGMVGQALAARHASMLRGLAILNSAAYYPDRGIWDVRIKAVREGGMQAIADSSIERWLTPVFRQSPAGQAMVSRLREMLLRTDPVGYVLTCEAIANMDFRATNRLISVPTLIVAGSQDMATPLAMSQAMADDIASARLVEVEAAHISTAEAQMEIEVLLKDWLRLL